MSVLEHYQRRLSELLRRGSTPTEIRAVLGRDPRLVALQDYVAQLDDAALEVAAELAARWGSES